MITNQLMTLFLVATVYMHTTGSPIRCPYPTYRKDAFSPQPSGKVYRLLWVRDDSVFLMCFMSAE